jgi:two-component system, NarL family, response regulator LiaR
VLDSDSMSTRIRVLIVDDQDAVRTGLRFFLLAFDDFELVGEAVNGEQALSLCDQVEPHIVLMDLAMPGMDGVSAIRELHGHWPQIKVIAMISFMEEPAIHRALEVGAINYLLKNVSADELAEAIRTAHAVQSPPLPKSASSALPHEYGSDPMAST